MQHDINPVRVQYAVSEVLREINGLSYGEALLVSAEVLGRLIVETCKTPVQMVDMARVAQDHINATITAGARAKGFGGYNGQQN